MKGEGRCKRADTPSSHFCNVFNSLQVGGRRSTHTQLSLLTALRARMRRTVRTRATMERGTAATATGSLPGGGANEPFLFTLKSYLPPRVEPIDRLSGCPWRPASAPCAAALASARRRPRPCVTAAASWTLMQRIEREITVYTCAPGRAPPVGGVRRARNRYAWARVGEWRACGGSNAITLRAVASGARRLNINLNNSALQLANCTDRLESR